MSTRPRLAATATLAVGLAAGLALGAGAVLAQEPAPASTPSTAIGTMPSAQPPAPGIPTLGTATGTATGTTTVSTAAGAEAVAGSAIAYPVYAGTPGIAPDHTIVVIGVGQAVVKSDGSNRAAAQKTALAAALADAKAQAEVVASATGLTISGVLSVSTSVSPYGYVLPMAAESGAPRAPVPGGTVATDSNLAVSVTVAYRVA